MKRLYALCQEITRFTRIQPFAMGTLLWVAVAIGIVGGDLFFTGTFWPAITLGLAACLGGFTIRGRPEERHCNGELFRFSTFLLYSFEFGLVVADLMFRVSSHNQQVLNTNIYFIPPPFYLAGYLVAWAQGEVENRLEDSYVRRDRHV